MKNLSHRRGFVQSTRRLDEYGKICEISSLMCCSPGTTEYSEDGAVRKETLIYDSSEDTLSLVCYNDRKLEIFQNWVGGLTVAFSESSRAASKISLVTESLLSL